MPQAVTYIMAKAGNPVGAYWYMWFTTWYSQIVGWSNTAIILGILYYAWDRKYWYMVLMVVALDAFGWLVFYTYKGMGSRYANYLY